MSIVQISTDVVSVSAIDISPVPKAGVTINIKATGVASEVISDASYKLEADLLGFPVDKDSGDLCAGTAKLKVTTDIS